MSARNKLTGNILLTGATSGLGLEISKQLLERGCTVYGTGRNRPSFLGSGDKFRFIQCDFSDLEQTYRMVCELCKEVKFNTVINNAGVLSPPAYSETSDGYEYSVQVNFLAHLLIDEQIIKNSGEESLPLFISVISPVYRRGDLKRASALISGNQDIRYNPLNAYSDSKLLLVNLMSYYSRLYQSGRFVSFNPGVFSSGIYRMQRDYFRKLYGIAAPFMRSPSSVAKSLIEISTLCDLRSGVVYNRSGRLFIPPEPSKEFEILINDLINSVNFTPLL